MIKFFDISDVDFKHSCQLNDVTIQRLGMAGFQASNKA